MPRSLSVVLVLFILAGCSLTPGPAEPTTAPTATSAPTRIPYPSATAIPPAPLPDFPLNGAWSGTAVNDGNPFDISLRINRVCQPGQTCGSFDIVTFQCSGDYVLNGEESGVYQFEIINKSAGCGVGIDSFELLPDDTLQYVSEGDYGRSEGILARVIVSPAPAGSIPVFFTDDGSPDGTTALLYLLSDPAVDMKAVAISHGEARPQVYIQHIGHMFNDFGLGDISLGAGQDTAIIPGDDFPEWIKNAADGFWGLPLPADNSPLEVHEAAQLLVDVLNRSDEPLNVFISGSCTDVALALRLDPGIRGKIKAVYIMGGAVYAGGNLHDFYETPTNVSAEWNIYIDPLAAHEVFTAGVPVVLVPLDATNQVTIGQADIAAWRAGGQIANQAADTYSLLVQSPDQQKMIWDVMTAVIMLHPELCPTVSHSLEVVTQAGNFFGQTRIVEGGEPNVQVCLSPDGPAIRQTLAETFAGSR
jgi:pyrimidine-specific ribonucleoside hydrolase